MGYGFMMVGLRELRQYHRPFLYSLVPLPFMMLGALWRALSSVASYLPGGLSTFFSNAAVTSFVKYAEFCLIFVFHMALFFGIYGIAKKIGLPKITSSTVFSAFAYCLYFVLYAILRFVLEFFRYDGKERGIWGIFSTSQWISLAILAGLAVWAVSLRRKERETRSGACL